MADGSGDAVSRRIFDRLGNAGWERAPDEEAADRVVLHYEQDGPGTGFALHHTTGTDWVRLIYVDEVDEVEVLRIEFGDELDGLLDLLVGVQDELDSDGWDDFARDLLDRCPDTYIIMGSGDDDLVRLPRPD
jgi:hypothetical protein